MSSDELCILAVEDNSDTRKLLQHMLQPQFDLVLVSNVEAALQASDEMRFDVLLLDINLSEEQTGLDLLHLLREREAYQNVPALALTAYALPGDRERFFEKGFDGYISKPFTRAGLVEHIQQAVPE